MYRAYPFPSFLYRYISIDGSLSIDIYISMYGFLSIDISLYGSLSIDKYLCMYGSIYRYISMYGSLSIDIDLYKSSLDILTGNGSRKVVASVIRQKKSNEKFKR